MKDNKGFTLLEMIGVITILALVALVAFPTILEQFRKTENKISDASFSIIKASADIFIDNNQPEYSKQAVIKNTLCIPLHILVKEALLPENMYDGETNEKIDMTQGVKLSIRNNDYFYEIVNPSDCQIKYTAYSMAQTPDDILILVDGSEWLVVSDSGVNERNVTLLKYRTLDLDNNGNFNSSGDKMQFDKNNSAVFNPKNADNIAYYINTVFKTELGQKGIKIEDGEVRLLTKAEYDNLKISAGATGTSWLYNNSIGATGSWWLQSVVSSTNVYIVNQNGETNSVASNTSHAVRPVIVVPKYNIERYKY